MRRWPFLSITLLSLALAASGCGKKDVVATEADPGGGPAAGKAPAGERGSGDAGSATKAAGRSGSGRSGSWGGPPGAAASARPRPRCPWR